MNNEPHKHHLGADAELEREIRQNRQFTPQEALARLAGPGALKGASPVSRLQQAEIEVGSWLKTHLIDATGALQLVLHRNINGSDQLLNNIDQPLAAVASYCGRVLGSEQLLREIVREADVEWGRLMSERPYFEREGCPTDADDPYTIESVRTALADALKQFTHSPGVR